MPLLAELVTDALPHKETAARFKQIARSWCAKFDCDRLALVWLDSLFGRWQYSEASASGSVRDRSVASWCDDPRSVLQSELCPNSDEIEWTPLTMANTTALIGLPAHLMMDEELEPWLRVTSSLLEDVLQRERELRDARLQSLGEYAAGAGHEINNPLGTITGRVDQLLRGETDPERRRQLETIGAQAYRVRDMIGDSMLFARPPKPKLTSVTVAEVVRLAVARFEEDANQQNVTLSLNAAECPAVSADADQVGVVVCELLRNALQAVTERGKIDIRIEPGQCIGADGVFLRVRQSGNRLTEEERRHCFDPFYSGRSAGRGLGFGLCKCWRILQQHRGRIELKATEDETCVAVFFRSAVGAGRSA